MTRCFVALALTFVIGAVGCSNKTGQTSPSNSSAANAESTAPGSPSQATGSDADAIRAAIQNHLRDNQSINLDAMDMTVDSVSIHGDQAQARAAFRIKNGGAGMAMTYFLQRSGGGWVVTRGEPTDKGLETMPMKSSPPGANSSGSAPALPDVNAYFQDHPARKSN
jgi:hypothetical protein